MRQVLDSFRLLNAAEAQAARPLQIRLVPAASGETVDAMAARMPEQDRAADLFRVLNGLDATTRWCPDSATRSSPNSLGGINTIMLALGASIAVLNTGLGRRRHGWSGHARPRR